MKTGSPAGKIASGLFLVAALAAAGGCAKDNGNDSNGSGGSTGKPRVMNTNPSNNALNVLVTTTIQVTFSEPMNTTTVNGAFSLKKSTGETVAGILSYSESGDVLVFTLQTLLDYSASYNGEVTTAATDLQGQAMGSSYLWTFATQPEPDVVDPNVRVTDYPVAAFNAFNFSSGQCGIGLYPPGSTQPTVYAAWYDFRNDDGIAGNSDVFFSSGANGGASFSANGIVNDDTGTAAQKYACMTVDQNGVIYIVWDDARNGNSDVYFTKSTDGGATWKPNVKVNDDTGAALQSAPVIAVSGGATPAIYVIWRDERDGLSEIYFAKSGNGGQSFGANFKISNVPPAVIPGIDPPLGHTHPSIAVTPTGTIAAVWRDERNARADKESDIYFAKSQDGGVGFGANIKINDDVDPDLGYSAAFQHDPTIRAAGNGDILIAWVDLRNSGNADIYFTRSLDGGGTFETNIRVNDFAQAGEDIPTMAVNSQGTIVMAWQDGRNALNDNGDLDIYMSRSYLLDGLLTFGVSQRVNDDVVLSKQFDVSIALDDQGVAYLTWADRRSALNPLAEESPGDIYFSKVTPAAP